MDNNNKPDNSSTKNSLFNHRYNVFLFAIVTWVFTLAFGFPITAALGPGTSGLVTTVITTMVVVIGIRIANRPFAAFLIILLFSILSIPFPFFGPIGPHKIILGFVVGLFYELHSLHFLRISSYWRLVIASSVATCVSLWVMYGMMIFFNLTGIEKLRGFVLVGSIVYAFLAAIGAIIGQKIYFKTLKNLKSTRQLED
ncbi:MAG: hypothetical protein J7K53_05515 [Bacteroidales bacterium]|nr:hypothetical protein [Bacteroidales bacterium]